MNQNKVIEIPNGVDLSLFVPSYSYTDEEKNKVIMCPRRITPKNGILYLINAIPLVIKARSQVKFMFVGPNCDKEYSNLLIKRVKQLGIEKYVFFAGNVKHAEMPQMYYTSDIVVIPSLIEAISLSALEAMACSKPVIATAVGGLCEIIKDGYNGMLVMPADSDCIAKAILSLLGDEERALKYALNGRKTAETFSWKRVASDTRSLYIKAINNNQ